MAISDRELLRRLDRIEAAGQTQRQDLASLIHAARANPPRPTHTRDELVRLAHGDSIQARIARGWLRISFFTHHSQRPPAIDPSQALAQMAGYLYDRPLEFVLFAFDWGHTRPLRVVRLPEALAFTYDSEYGPDQWTCDLFEDLARQVRDNAFDGTSPVPAQRHAIASGHGIGKSATTGMLVNFLMSTRPNARGVITANTSPQLESKTWAEIAKWHKRSLFADWFDVTTGRGSMKMTHVDSPESWRCDAQTCREENSEAFAGLHAADSTPFFVFDEASAVPDTIHEVAQGGLTDGEPMLFAFGNPTRNSGWFFETFHGQRHRWNTRQIDSRDVQLTNKDQIQQWVDDYGEDADFVRIRVRGVFPRAATAQFIPTDIVDEAMSGEPPPARAFSQPAVVGVDVARFGDDSSVIFTRIGRDARAFPPAKFKGLDTMAFASKVAAHINHLRGMGLRVVTFVDGGGVGGGVVDRLRQMHFPVVDVQFGSRADDPRKHANKRAQMWDGMRDWLKAGGKIPNDRALAAELTGVEYGFSASDQIQLERKQDMKSRGLGSPDMADALALTFAAPVVDIIDDIPEPATYLPKYDPIKSFEKELAALRHLRG